MDQSDQVTCPRSHSRDEGTKVFSSIINCCLTRLTETLPLEKQRKTTYNPRHQVQSRGRRCLLRRRAGGTGMEEQKAELWIQQET